MQTRVYSGSAQPGLHPLSYSFNPELEVPLIQGFQTKPSSNTIGLWFQFTLLDFWLQAPFALLKSYPTLEQPLKCYPSLEKIPLKDLQIKWSLKNLSTRPLSSNDTNETRIGWYNKDMQVLE